MGGEQVRDDLLGLLEQDDDLVNRLQDLLALNTIPATMAESEERIGERLRGVGVLKRSSSNL